MPTVKLLKKPNSKRINWHRKDLESDERRKIRNRFYNSKTYQKVRLWKLHKNPICEICESVGRIRAVEEVHHWVSPFASGDEAEMKELGNDFNNLVSLCSKCHHELHTGELQNCHSMQDVNDRIKFLKKRFNIDY